MHRKRAAWKENSFHVLTVKQIRVTFCLANPPSLPSLFNFNSPRFLSQGDVTCCLLLLRIPNLPNPRRSKNHSWRERLFCARKFNIDRPSRFVQIASKNFFGHRNKKIRRTLCQSLHHQTRRRKRDYFLRQVYFWPGTEGARRESIQLASLSTHLHARAHSGPCLCEG